MKFPSAHAGVKKIFLAALFELIATVLTIVSAVLIAINEKNFADGVLALGLAAGALALVAFIFQLIGLNQARRDDRSFGSALWVVFIAILATLVSIILSFFKGEWVAYVTGGLDAFVSACGTVVVIYIVTGIFTLANKLGEKGFADNGRALRVILTVLFIIAIVLRLLASFLRPNQDIITVMGYVSIGSAALQFIAEIWYFIYLARAPRKLSK